MMEAIEAFVSSTRYPWDEWFDGQARKATRGVDFTVSAENFRSTVKAAAQRKGLDAKTQVRGDSVIFQAVPRVVQSANEG